MVKRNAHAVVAVWSSGRDSVFCVGQTELDYICSLQRDNQPDLARPFFLSKAGHHKYVKDETRKLGIKTFSVSKRCEESN